MNKRRYFKELRLQQFRALMEVARKGTFTAAAEALGLSRTSVWQQIRSLEDDFGVELATVKGQKLNLTTEGQELLRMIEPIVDGFDSVKAAFLDRLGKMQRRLVVATTASLLNHELREPVEIYRRSHPDVSLSLVDRPSKSALELLSHGEADVAIIGRVINAKGSAAMKTQVLTHYPFVLACPKKHDLIQRKTFKLTDLAKFPLILSSRGTNARERVESVFQQAGLSDSVQLALDSNNAGLLLSYVEHGLGVALTSVSPLLQKSFADRIAFRDVCDIFGKEEITLVQRPQRYPLAHASVFIDVVLRSLNVKRA